MSDYKDGFVEAYDQYFNDLTDLAERLDVGILFAAMNERDEMDPDELPANVKEYDEGYSDGLSAAKANALSALRVEELNADEDAKWAENAREKETPRQ